MIMTTTMIVHPHLYLFCLIKLIFTVIFIDIGLTIHIFIVYFETLFIRVFSLDFIYTCLFFIMRVS